MFVPALLTRMSRASIAPMSRVRSAAEATSAAMPRVPSSFAHSCTRWPVRAAPITVAPRAMNSSAMARPMPEVQPVTRAVRPLRFQRDIQLPVASSELRYATRNAQLSNLLLQHLAQLLGNGPRLVRPLDHDPHLVLRAGVADEDPSVTGEPRFRFGARGLVARQRVERRLGADRLVEQNL